MTFWIAAALLTLGLAALLWRALGKPAAAAERSAAAADIGVYRDQLAEIARDAARGTIGEAEAERSRIEISRRILDADRAARNAAAGQAAGGPRLVAALVVAVALAGAFWLYREIGAPGYPDLPIADRLDRAAAFRADRPSQAEAEAEAPRRETATPEPDYAELMERLRATVAERPDDLTGQRLLARNEAALGNYGAAAAAQARVVSLSGASVVAADYATLADLYVLATGGYVSPEAEAAASEALARDPKNRIARFYMGLMWAQTGRPDLSFQVWRALLEEGPADAPWIAPIREQIGLVARAAGVDYTPPAAAAGPGAGDVAAAAEMSEEDRMTMIRGMVEQLSGRLATEGGSPEEWARLITSLGVLGETERARAIYREAQEKFTGQAAALEALDRAAAAAGVDG